MAEPADSAPSPAAQGLAYGALNLPVLDRIPRGARRILDLGCGTGALGAAVKQRQDAWVLGVTFSATEAAAARERIDRVVEADLHDFDPAGLGPFDAVVCSHVLEHLHTPERLLRVTAPEIAPGHGRLVVALPNVLFWKQRLEFLGGKFRYTDGGLMDRTHAKFYDHPGARALLEEAGFAVEECSADGTFPQPGLRRVLGARVSGALDRAMVRRFPGLFGFQFVLTARPAAVA